MSTPPEVRIKCRNCGEFNTLGPARCVKCNEKLHNSDRCFVTRAETTRACPWCAEPILPAAIVCKHCKRDVEPVTAEPPKWVETTFHSGDGAATATQSWNPGVAAVLSFFIPGAGQLYKGQLGKGLLFFFGAVIGYTVMIVPGLIVHLFAIIDANTAQP